jgi:hypothetical protein
LFFICSNILCRPLHEVNVKANKVCKIAKNSFEKYGVLLALFIFFGNDPTKVTCVWHSACVIRMHLTRELLGWECFYTGTFSCLISHFSVIKKRRSSCDLVMGSIDFLLLSLGAWASVKRFVSLQFLNLRHSVGFLGRGISLTQGRNLHRTIRTQNKRVRMSMSGVRTHDPGVRVSEDSSCLIPRAVTVIGC